MMKRLLSVLLAALMLCGCSAALGESDALRVVALKGPTAMGLVQMMSADNPARSFQIVSDIQLVPPMVVKGEVDIAALPANMASILYQNPGVDVQVLAVNTLGVLYLVESGDTVHSVADLKGRTIYASGKGATPEYALNYILAANGLDPQHDVNLEWRSEHTECLNMLLAGEDAIAMLPQPFVTTAMMKADGLRIAIDLNAEWSTLSPDSALITGAVIARTDYIRQHPDEVAAFMDDYSASVEWVNSHVDEAAELIGAFDIVPAQVARQALPACNIVFIEGDALQQKLGGYLAELYRQNPQSVGGAVPDDAFYYHR